MKLKAVILWTNSIYILCVLNVFVLIAVLHVNPSLLIDKKLAPENKSVINYLLFEDREVKRIFSENEFNHLQDVRSLLIKIVISSLVSFGVVLFLLSHLGAEMINKSLNYTLLLIPVVVVAVVGIFEPIFILFHQIAFPQGNWAFPSDALIIKIYPNSFWVTSTIIILVSALIELICLKIVLSYREKLISPIYSV